MVGTMASLIPLGILAELVNIGTLLAFVIVCMAVLVMRYIHPQAERPFRCPWVPVIPILGVILCLDPDAVAALWELAAAVRLDGRRHVHLLPLRPPPQRHGPPKAGRAGRQRRLRAHDALTDLAKKRPRQALDIGSENGGCFQTADGDLLVLSRMSSRFPCREARSSSLTVELLDYSPSLEAGDQPAEQSPDQAETPAGQDIGGVVGT